MKFDRRSALTPASRQNRGVAKKTARMPHSLLGGVANRHRDVPVLSCFETGCSALFERLPDQVEDKLLIMIACNTAFPTDAGSFPVKRNTLAVSREFALHRKR